jgi:EmrB/QacA subfamily drug resistance transporter
LASAARLRSNPWVVLVVLCLGLFMTLLDITIVNIAIPSLSRGLHASLDQVLWVVNAYSLVYAVLLITSGRLGDIFGPRNLFAGGLGLFTVASALSGMAQGPEQLIAARALQGLGAAIAGPQGLPIMLSVFPADRRGGVFATYGVIGGLAVLAGPTLGGLLVTDLGWRWIFYVNIPVGLATIALALLLVPDLRPGRRHRLDLAGVLLATLGLLGVVYGLIEGERYGWGSVAGPVTIPAVIAAGVLVLVAFLIQQALRQRSEPLLPFAVFKDRNFSLMTLVMLCLGVAMVGFYLPLTLYLQTVLGLSAIAAGLTIAPQPLAMMLTSGFSAALVAKVNAKWLLLPGLVLFAAGMGYIVWAAHPTAGPWDLLPGLVASGIGLAFTWTPVFSLATRDLSPRLGGVASGVISTLQELGTVLGAAVVGALLQHRLAAELQHHLYGQAFTTAFRGSALLPILAMAFAAAACLAVRSRSVVAETAGEVAA